ncbi:cysteine--tRNA ligase [bacterium]|nr:cysteine--tRNA ligase [bacterium]
MSMRLFETLSRAVKELKPSEGDTYRFYCCGPTVYGPAHIGNFRTFVLQDVFRRVLELSGTPTKHVRNITDVDDKTIRDSRKAGMKLIDFTNDWRDRFHVDCKELNLLEPHVEQSAVGSIPEQIDLIKTLVEKSHAYQGEDGSVYFKVESFEKYGRLSHLDERELRSGSAQTNNDSDEYEKESLADFALWKARKEDDGDNFWESPWGEGRPGWHIECSAMCIRHFGNSFDLHSGGVDLIFPHHENEIAQAEAATGETFAMHWFHIEHLMVDGGKMSKSLGNLYTIEDLKEKGYTAAEVRYVLASGYYRQQLNFTLDTMTAARHALGRLAKMDKGLGVIAGQSEAPEYEDSLKLAGSKLSLFGDAFGALLEDLNTPAGLGKMFVQVKGIERRLVAGDIDPETASTMRSEFHFILSALGLMLPEEQKIDVPADIQELAAKRWEAKQAKNWSESDTYRDELNAAGWQVKDGSDSYDIVPL